MFKRKTTTQAKSVTVSRQKELFTKSSDSKNTDNSIFSVLKKGDKFGTVNVPSKLDIEKYKPHQIYEYIYSGKFNDLDSSVFDKEAIDREEMLIAMTRELKVDDGVYECPKCHYNRIRIVQKQLRSGDESATVLGKCMRCSTDIKDSG